METELWTSSWDTWTCTTLVYYITVIAVALTAYCINNTCTIITVLQNTTDIVSWCSQRETGSASACLFYQNSNLEEFVGMQHAAFLV